MLVYIETEEFIETILNKYEQTYPLISDSNSRISLRILLEEIIEEKSFKASRKETSPRMSSLAGKYMNWQAPSPEWEALAEDVRSMAASIVSQDETKGQQNE